MSATEPHFREKPPEVLPNIERVPVFVVLDNIRSAYNVGSIFRTSDAGAVAHIHLCGMSAHPPHKKLEKTALGADDYVPWSYWERTRDCLEALRSNGVAIVGVEVAEGAVPHTRYEWPTPVAIVFGNEVDGINERRLRQCDAVVQIPMRGFKNSMNVATAFGVILYDILARWKCL